MKMTERIQGSRRTFLAIVGVAMAAALVLPTSAVGQTTTVVTDVDGSAYALQVGPEGSPLEAGPYAAITAPPCPQSSGVPSVNVGDVIRAATLATSAQCTDPTDVPNPLPSAAGFIRMTADVARVAVGDATTVTQPALEVGGVHVECRADVDEVDGFTSIATLSTGGVPRTNVGRFDDTTDLSLLVAALGGTLIINEETRSPDGNTVTINGVHLILPAQPEIPEVPGDPGVPAVPATPALDLIIGHVECTRALAQQATTTTAGDTTTTAGDNTTTTAGDNTTTTRAGTATTAGGTATTAGPRAATTVPTGRLARTGAMVSPWLLVAAAAMVLGGLMRFGSAGLSREVASPVASLGPVFRPVRPGQTRADRHGRGPLDAAAADALTEMEGSSPSSGSAPQAPVEQTPPARRTFGRRRRW